MALIDLGYAMVRIKKDARHRTHTLQIVVPSDSSDGGFYTPAESVTIYGEPALIALRDALNEAYPVDATAPANGEI